MSDDEKKLPARIEPAGLPEAPQNRSWLGWVGSAFGSILNTKTLQKKTEEAEAYREYIEESARIPGAMLERDRAVDHYLNNRDAVIKNDRNNHQRRMEREEIQREIEAEEDLQNLQMLRLKHQEQALNTQRRVARAQLFLDTFSVTAPHQKDSEESKSRKGAAHAKLDMLAVLQAFLEDEETDNAKGSSCALTPEQQLALIEKMIDECLSTSTPEQMQLLYVKRAQLKNQIEEEKGRSG
jgi:hypothetical protein